MIFQADVRAVDTKMEAKGSVCGQSNVDSMVFVCRRHSSETLEKGCYCPVRTRCSIHVGGGSSWLRVWYGGFMMSVVKVCVTGMRRDTMPTPGYPG